jgi:uncharacterized membrane protein
MSVPTRILLAITVLVIATLLIFSATVYGDLPARIPTHFNAAGIPDGFGPRNRWWLLPAISVVSAVVTVGISLMLPSRPDLLNVPSKREILALPPAAQAAVVRQAQPGFMVLGVIVAAMSLFLQYSTWQVALGRTAAGNSNLIIIFAVAGVALFPVILLPVSRELRRQQAKLGRP